MSNFIPSFHLTPTSKKLTNEWCEEVVDYLYFNSDKKSLLHNKKIEEIEQYSIGEFDMEPFRRLFKSIKKSFVANNPHLTMKDEGDIDSKMQFEPLPLIPIKLNSAISVIQKIPVEVTVTALDPLAAKKKDEDIRFLKNKPKIEADLQDIADQMQMDKIDLGTTKHSYIPYSNSPYGLDIADEEEAEIFSSIIYSLGVEVSFETVMQIYYEIKKATQVKALEIADQFKFGISCNSATINSLTGLPDLEYKFPNDIETQPSNLPDFSDNKARFEKMSLTPIELFNYFSGEICSMESLDEIINSKTTGYCPCNNKGAINKKDFGSAKISLIKVEVKSVDAIGVIENKKGRKFKRFADPEDSRCTSKIWGQNVYCFYWLENTQHFFNKHTLDYAYRTLGQESIQNFSTNIYRSQKKSAVELSIKENKKAQSADIKMQYAILMSLPAGKYIDLRFLRGAIDGLKDEDTDGDDSVDDSSGKYTMEYLIDLALERNIILGDTEGFDGASDGQFKPFMDIAGGLKTEITGYRDVLSDAKKNISEFTGINEQLTGQGVNPEGLIGLQKLLINSSLNSLYYANEAINFQQQCIFNCWGYAIKRGIEQGGAVRKSIERMIGDKKVNIIDRLDEIPLHTLGIKVTTNQREEERAKFEERKGRLKQSGAITVADEYMLDAIQNPKDKIALLSIKEKQFIKRQQIQRQEDARNQQALVQVATEGALNVKKEDNQGKQQQIYAKGEVQAKVMELASRLGLNAAQFEVLAKKMLQQDRQNAQVDKGVRLLDAKENIKQSQSIQ